MTELEKVKQPLAQEVDFNKLVNELHDKCSSYTRQMLQHNLNDTVPPPQEALAPTLDILQSLNCFLNHIRVDDKLAFMMVAAVEILKDTLEMCIEDEAKEMKNLLVNIITPSIRAVNVSAIQAMKEGEK